MKNKPYPCADCGHYTRSHANGGGTTCWCGCAIFREPELGIRLKFLLDELTEDALNLTSFALDAESRRAENADWQRRLADEAWSAANRLRDVLYACPTCGHSAEPLGPGSNGDHSEDDGSCWACGPALGQRCASDESEPPEQAVLCRLQCPDCGELIPVGVKPGEVIDGEILIESDLSEVWAHAWTHDREEPS